MPYVSGWLDCLMDSSKLAGLIIGMNVFCSIKNVCYQKSAPSKAKHYGRRCSDFVLSNSCNWQSRNAKTSMTTSFLWIWLVMRMSLTTATMAMMKRMTVATMAATMKKRMIIAVAPMSKTTTKLSMTTIEGDDIGWDKDKSITTRKWQDNRITMGNHQQAPLKD